MPHVIDHPLSSGNPPEWASAWGQDKYGVFVAFRIGDVEQHMRWIRPGTFWMGSPENERGRDDDETRHRVTISEGFWMAETPCTQALWEAIMGENPSRFESPERPVEQVSWDDCQSFMRRLGERIPGLDPRLPSEAEWENACRAGTKHATYAGDLEILGECTAPVLDEIAWYGGNSGVDFDLEDGADSSGWPNKQYEHSKAGTRIVGQKKRNPWGLYDTLGNVYEWCHDWYRKYTHRGQFDPTDANEGIVRVARGGSWVGNVQYVRAAYRDRYQSSDRLRHLGFRLARGQGLRSGR